MTEPTTDDPIEALRRWTTFGGTWEVVHRWAGLATLSLRRCDGGEEVQRLFLDAATLDAFLEAST